MNVCPYCGIEVQPSEGDPQAFAVGVDGSMYCPPDPERRLRDGSVDNRVFPLHGWVSGNNSL